MKKASAYWILATALLALSGTPALTAQTAQARNTTELEAIQAEMAGTTTLLARKIRGGCDFRYRHKSLRVVQV